MDNRTEQSESDTCGTTSSSGEPNQRRRRVSSSTKRMAPTSTQPKNHRDLAHLVANVDNPIALGVELKAHERRLLAERLDQRLVKAGLAAIGNDAVARLRLLAAAPAR
jgi:hypothetical protein